MAEEVEGYDVGSMKGILRARVLAVRAKIVSMFTGKDQEIEQEKEKKDQ